MAALAALLLPVAAFSQSTIVYDNTTTSATAGYSDLNANNPVFGDSLTLTQGGLLNSVAVSLYNSTTGGNTGAILTGTMLISFYDNTVPYSGGTITDPLLGTATVNWDFTGSGGLPAGFYSTSSFNLSSLNITLPQNILITQAFTETSGTSTRNGFVLVGNPTIGSSPSTVYIQSASTSAGLYTFNGNAGQLYYQVTVVPEPASWALCLVGLPALLVLRRRQPQA